MSSLNISEGIVIDEVLNVLKALQTGTGRKIKDAEIIKTFVNKEANTKFYIDDKLNSYMCNEASATYLWLDTGFVNFNNETIFVSLHRSMYGFAGHITGTAKYLANTMKNSNKRAKSCIDSNYSKFMNKYANKVKERTFQHITDINGFLIAVNNMDSGKSDNPFEKLNLADFIKDEEPNALDVVTEQEVIEDNVLDFTEMEEKITISYLMDRLDIMDDYIKMLQDTIKELKDEKDLSSKRIEELEAKKKEYERSFVQMRLEIQKQDDIFQEREIDVAKRGHNLLDGYGKILVLGASDIDNDVMQGIAKKQFGFEKNDIDFETDYEKSVDVAGRIMNGGRYKIIILGAMPHSVKGRGDDTSMVTALKHNCNIPILFDCRNISGKLKITKESFKKALEYICNELENKAA